MRFHALAPLLALVLLPVNLPAAAPTPAASVQEQRLGGSTTKAHWMSTMEDGGHVAYIAYREDKAFVVLNDKEGPLFDAIAYKRLFFSRDGKHVAYEARKGSKWMIVVDGQAGPEYDRIGEWPEKDSRAHPPSPNSIDSNWLSLSDDGRHTFYTVFKDGKWHAVVDGKEGPPYDAIHGWGSEELNGRPVAHIQYHARKGAKWVVVIDGQESPEYDAFARPYYSVFVREGRHATYVAKRGAQWFVVVDGVESPAYDQVESLRDAYPDNRVSYFARRGQTWSVVVDGRVVLEYDASGSAAPPAYAALVFSPDGRRMAIQARRNSQWVLVVDGKEAGPPADAIEAVTFSEDGNHLAYVARSGQKWAAVLDGKPGQPYDEIGDISVKQSVMKLVLGRDGAHLSYRARKGEKWVFVTDGKEGPAYEEISSAAYVTPDGSHTIYVARKGPNWLTVVDGQEGPPFAENILGLSGSPDGRRVGYLVSEKSGRPMFAVVDGQAGPKYNHIVGAPRFGPDGKHVIIQAMKGQQWVVVVDGVEGPLYDEINGPVFQPDGSVMYLGERDNAVYRVRVAAAGSAAPPVVPSFSQVARADIPVAVPPVPVVPPPTPQITLAPPMAASLATARQQLEAMAQRVTHVATEDIIYNRWSERRWPANLLAEQTQLLADLRALGGQQDALAALLKHSDPKIRTLALGALFVREDARDLPLIAALMGDTAATFPLLGQSASSGFGTPSLAQFESPQAVGDVAQAMIQFYLSAANSATFYPRKADTLTTAFNAYWAAHGKRAHNASWFLVRMHRATRQSTPRPEYAADVQRVLADIAALPPAERAWTLLFVRSALSVSHPEELITDESLVTALKHVGPSTLLNFLQHKPVTDDPDLQFDATRLNPRNAMFHPMAKFILRHARDLLRAEDADAVLVGAGGEPQKSQGDTAEWVAAAAELIALQDPAKAGDLLRTAQQDKTPGGPDQAVLMGTLWRTRGMTEKSALVDWFYLAAALADENDNVIIGPARWLREVADAQRADTPELLSAIGADPRFEQTGWGTLAAFLQLVNSLLPAPLVPTATIYDYQPSSRRRDQAVALAAWRNTVRRHFGLPERVAVAPAVPQSVLTQPTAASAFNGWPVRMLVSSDGRLLAVINARQVDLRETATRARIGLLKPQDNAPLLALAFPADGARAVALVGNNYMSGDKVTTIWAPAWGSAAPSPVVWISGEEKLLSRQKLDTLPEKDAGPGVNAMNPTGTMVVVNGKKSLSCYDARTGKLVWRRDDAGDDRGGQVVFSSDGKLVAATTSSGRAVQLFDAGTGAPMRAMEAQPGQVQALAFAPDSQTLAATLFKDGIRLWETATGRLTRAIPCPTVDARGTLVFSPDGRWLATQVEPPPNPDRIESPRINIFAAATGVLRWEVRAAAARLGGSMTLDMAGGGRGLAFAFSPDGKTLHTVGSQLAVWTLE